MMIVELLGPGGGYQRRLRVARSEPFARLFRISPVLKLFEDLNILDWDDGHQRLGTVESPLARAEVDIAGVSR